MLNVHRFLRYLVFLVLLGCVGSVRRFPLTKLPPLPSLEDFQSNGNKERSDGVVTFMYGGINTTFEYFAGIEIGSDRQVFTVQVDTGSSGLAVPAKGCTEYSSNGDNTGSSCPVSSELYDSSQSQTSKTLSCSDYTCVSCSQSTCWFGMQYGDGSFVRGPVIRDNISMAGLSALVEFGAINQESQSFQNKGVDGIMGMSYQILTPGLGSVFESFVKNSQCSNSFSMCLGKTGGMLVLGGVDDSFSDGRMVYTPIIKELYYNVQVMNMVVNNVPLNLSPSQFGTTIVDSGTTLLYLASPVYQAVRNQLLNACQPIYKTLCDVIYSDQCSNVKLDIIQNQPSVGLIFNNITLPLVLEPEDYFIQIQDQGNTFFCFGIYQLSDMTILGDVFMQKFNTFFDRQNKQIGFAPVKDCEASPISLAISSGDSQSGPMFFTLPNSLVVEVRYQNNGMPATGIVVDWTIVSGKATILRPRSLVDANGLASTEIKIILIGSVEIEATPYGIQASPVRFKISGTAWIPGIFIGLGIAIVLIAGIVAIIYFIRKRRRRTQGFQLLVQTDQSGE